MNKICQCKKVPTNSSGPRCHKMGELAGGGEEAFRRAKNTMAKVSPTTLNSAVFRFPLCSHRFSKGQKLLDHDQKQTEGDGNTVSANNNKDKATRHNECNKSRQQEKRFEFYIKEHFSLH